MEHTQTPRPSTNELLTDLYQITMNYSYFKQGRHNIPAVFDAFFRKAPFKGTFTVFAGLKDVVNFIKSFKFKEDQIQYLKELNPHWTDDFFDYLRSLDASHIKIYGIQEGTMVFPNAPLVRLEGPIGFLQIIETTILNLMNFPTLIATNARRMKFASNDNQKLIEFGLRRAQGPDGAMMATQYSYLGGFDGTSNVSGGMAYGIQVFGTMAHAFVCSFHSFDDLKVHTVNGHDLKELAIQIRKEMQYETTHEGELAAFIGYACTHPNGFLALVDTYNTVSSGVPNFVAVAIAMKRIGLEPKGIRLDSGDLAKLSITARKFINEQGEKFGVDLSKTVIFASNDLNESTLIELKAKGHALDSYGVGTNLVTCQAQPALGMVYKLVEFDGIEKIKFSEDLSKISTPGRKSVYRIYDKKDGFAVFDVLAGSDEEIKVGSQIAVRDLSNRLKKIILTPEKIENLLELFWDGHDVTKPFDLHEARAHCQSQIPKFDPKIFDLKNPEPYHVYITQKLFDITNSVIEDNLPH